MKKAIVIAMGLLLMALPASAKYWQIKTTKVLDAETVAAGETATSTAIDLNGPELAGYFSLQVALTGDGTAKFEYQVSNNGTDYVEPTGATDIATGITKASGPGTNGKDIYSFSPVPANYIRIKVTETGTSNSVTVSAWLTVH